MDIVLNQLHNIVHRLRNRGVTGESFRDLHDEKDRLLEDLAKISYNEGVILTEDKLIQEHYTRYLIKYLEYITDHPNDKLKELILNEIVHRDRIVIPKIEYYSKILPLLVDRDVNIIFTLTQYMYEKNIIKYIPLIIDKIDRDKLKKYLHDTYMNTDEQIMALFTVFNFSFTEIVEVSVGRTELLDKIILNQI